MATMIDDLISKEWVDANCKTKEEVNRLTKEGFNEAIEVLKTKPQEITTTPFTVYAKQFKTEWGFPIFMDIVGKMYSKDDSVVVKYAKPENKETGDIEASIIIVKSKAKMFTKYMQKENTILSVVVNSNKELKQIIKMLNSYGVKDAYGESIADSFSSHETPVTFDVTYDDKQLNTVIMTESENTNAMSVDDLKRFIDGNVFGNAS